MARRIAAAAWALLLCLCLAPWADLAAGESKRGNERRLNQEEEVGIPEAWQKKMDEAERFQLGKADKKYAEGGYKEALALYDVYLNTFPKSAVVPYALLRKGRTYQHLLKRREAVAALQELMDFFPNVPEMAAPALFYQGQCHFLNGDDAEAVKVWANIAKDEQFRVQPIAAFAINQLADYLAKPEQGKGAMAAGYWWQVAIDFRDRNPKASSYAIGRVVWWYTRMAPDEGKLREFYKATSGWGQRREKVADDVGKDQAYWTAVVLGAVRQHGRFEALEGEVRKRYFTYWAAQTEGKFPQWDDFQLAGAEFVLNAENDKSAWLKRLDDIYAKGQRAGDHDRTIRWMDMMAVAEDKARAQAYYQKLDLGALTYKQQRAVADILYIKLKETDLGKAVIARIDLSKLADAERSDLAQWLWEAEDEETGMTVNASIQDKELMTFNLLNYYASVAKKKGDRYVALAVAAADALRTSKTYVERAMMAKGKVLEGAKQYDEAIAAYRAADSPPKNIWAISACYAKSGRLEPAVQELRDLEAVYPTEKAKAAQGIAQLYLRAGDAKRGTAITELHRIMATYPKSPESSWAHERLEELNVKIKGGNEAE